MNRHVIFSIKTNKMSITLNELYDIKRTKEKKQLESFNSILELSHRKIRRIAEHGGYNTFFAIPGMLIGLPLYNVDNCIKHIISALKRTGFLVQRLPEPNTNMIYISWDPEDVNIDTKKSKKGLYKTLSRT